MDLPFDLNPSDYATAPPSLDVAATIALGHRLLSVAPADLPDHAVVNRNMLSTAITTLGRVYGLFQTAEPALPKRPIDQSADNSWASVKSRIEPWTWSLDSDHKDVAPARELSRKLFPDGTLLFTKLDYNSQWAEANWRIELLEREQQLPLLRRLIGDFFVDQLLMWHERYTAMVGVSPQGKAAKPATRTKAGKGKPKPATPNKSATNKEDAAALADGLSVGELRRRAQQAIVGWQLTLVTLHLSGHKGARAALQPTDEFRARAQSGSRSPTEPSPGDAPTPAGPTAPEGPAASPDDATSAPT